MNLSVFAATFVVFFVAHGIADYWVQTDWQAQNKSKNPVALWRHVLTYSVTFVPALIFLGLVVPLAPWQIPVALLAIALPHAALDNRKLVAWFCERTKGWRRDNMVDNGDGTLRPLNPWEIAVRFHVTIALDQKAHFLCLAVVAAWLAF